ncbi:uncharacterized protein [Typha angustifolia]|uniref:uncharacterized protein n=1 Tax=Typha angustifolia TaxID=59011 RepID=UPI003C2C1374
MDEEDIREYNGESNDAVNLNGSGGGETSIDITALDGIISHNSLFTLAVFAGISSSPSSGDGLSPAYCAAGGHVDKDLVSFQVFAFASFLFSNLVALALKQAIRLARRHGRHVARVNRAMFRFGILASAVGSMSGCGFLMLALVNVVQIKLGRLGCGAASTIAIISLVTLIPAAMLIYSAIVFHALIDHY